MEGIQPPVQTFAWDYWSGHDNLSDVFDGLKAYGDNPRLQFLFENYGYLTVTLSNVGFGPAFVPAEPVAPVSPV